MQDAGFGRDPSATLVDGADAAEEILVSSSLDLPEAEHHRPKNLGSLTEEQQAQVNQWFKAEHSVLHELYRSFCSLVYGEEIPGRARLISHCIREIRSILLSHIVAEESARLEYPKEIDAIARDWAETGPSSDGLISENRPTAPPTSTRAYVQIEQGLAIKIHQLIEQHNAIRTTNTEKTIQLFKYFQITEAEGITSLEVLAKNWKSLIDWFVAITHERSRTDNNIINDEFIRNVQAFEQSIHHFATAPAFFEGLEEIDEILARANS